MSGLHNHQWWTSCPLQSQPTQWKTRLSSQRPIHLPTEVSRKGDFLSWQSTSICHAPRRWSLDSPAARSDTRASWAALFQSKQCAFEYVDWIETTFEPTLLVAPSKSQVRRLDVQLSEIDVLLTTTSWDGPNCRQSSSQSVSLFRGSLVQKLERNHETQNFALYLEGRPWESIFSAKCHFPVIGYLPLGGGATVYTWFVIRELNSLCTACRQFGSPNASSAVLGTSQSLNMQSQILRHFVHHFFVKIAGWPSMPPGWRSWSC